MIMLMQTSCGDDGEDGMEVGNCTGLGLCYDNGTDTERNVQQILLPFTRYASVVPENSNDDDVESGNSLDGWMNGEMACGEGRGEM